MRESVEAVRERIERKVFESLGLPDDETVSALNQFGYEIGNMVWATVPRSEPERSPARSRPRADVNNKQIANRKPSEIEGALWAAIAKANKAGSVFNSQRELAAAIGGSASGGTLRDVWGKYSKTIDRTRKPKAETLHASVSTAEMERKQQEAQAETDRLIDEQAADEKADGKKRRRRV